MSIQKNIIEKIQNFAIVAKSFYFIPESPHIFGLGTDSKTLKEHFQSERELYLKKFKILEDTLMKIQGEERMVGFRVNCSWSSPLEKIAMEDFDKTLKKLEYYLPKNSIMMNTRMENIFAIQVTLTSLTNKTLRVLNKILSQ
jgi:hypothetical protein